MVRFAHAFIFYIAMVMTGLMLFFSSCHAAPHQPLLDAASALALAKSDNLVKNQPVNDPAR